MELTPLRSSGRVLHNACNARACGGSQESLHPDCYISLITYEAVSDACVIPPLHLSSPRPLGHDDICPASMTFVLSVITAVSHVYKLRGTSDICTVSFILRHTMYGHKI